MAEPDFLEIRSPLPGINLRLINFTGHEELSRLYSFTLEMQADTLQIKPGDFIGKPLGFSVNVDAGKVRNFHGIVTRFARGRIDGNRRLYQADVAPALWRLTRTSDCRIYSKKTVLETVESIFKEHGIKFESKLSQDHPKWVYNVQYRETDFNFVSRILEQEGIFYFFKHEADSHTLVLGDKPASFGGVHPDCKEVRYEYSFAPKKHSITAWTRQFEFIPGKYTQSDYNFVDFPSKAEQTPANLLLTSASARFGAQEPPPEIKPDKHELFDYPAEYEVKADEQFTIDRMEEEQATFDVAAGSSLNRFFGAGVKFKLKDHAPQADASDDGEYVLTSVHHVATNFSETAHLGGGANYYNNFTCIPQDTPFRPARRTPKPAIHGVQTAVVIGPPGVEIFPNEFGQVQVQFFWDRLGKRLQGAQEEPIFVRVAQMIAGKNWGAMFIPRVGQEVMVAFEEGDPDRPLITGVLYNSDQMPPYNPKDEPTKSYIKTNSSPGGDGFNELRFEDKKGKEQLFLHAERNMDVRVKHDSMERILGDRHQEIGGEKDGKKTGDQRELVWHDKHLHIKGSQHEQIEGSLQLTIGCGDGENPGKADVVIEKQANLKVGPDGVNLMVEGNVQQKFGCDVHSEVGMNYLTKVETKYAVQAGKEIHLKSDVNLVIEAGVSLTLKVGGNFININSSGVSIQGTAVLVNSGGAAGSGGGAPVKPPAAAESAAPTKPDQADDHKTGKKSTPF